jgi:DNA-directed RNA polymerase subunit RPC12/RpoP
MSGQDRKQIVCPYCGYRMQIYADRKAESHGLYVRCKGRNCKKEFEIKIDK